MIGFRDVIEDLSSLHLFTSVSSGWLTFYPKLLSHVSTFTPLLDCIQDKKKGHPFLPVPFDQGEQSFTKAALPPAVVPLPLIGQN